MAVLKLVSFVFLPEYYNFFHVVLFPNKFVRTTCKMEGYEGFFYPNFTLPKRQGFVVSQGFFDILLLRHDEVNLHGQLHKNTIQQECIPVGCVPPAH